MSATHALATVSAATRPGSGRNEDRHFIGDRFAVVLDGASTPDPEPLDGGWYADKLGTSIASRLATSPTVDLRDVVAQAITDVAALASMTPGRGPSSTVAIFRWDRSHGEALVLGDSPVIVQTTTGIEQVRDGRLTEIATEERRAYRDALRARDGYGDRHRARMRAVVEAERARRNRPDGYWIAEADPSAGHHAILRRWPLQQLRTVLLATDGLSHGVDQLGTPSSWADAIDLGRTRGLGALLDQVHDAEATDPDGHRWPRSKAHDDKTAVLVTFDQPD